MRIYIGSDHAGYELKEVLKEYIAELGHDVEDKGAHEYDETDDYTDYIAPVAGAVSEAIEQGEDDNVRGIILGGSGQGEAMIANRFPHVRATVYYGGPYDIVKTSREHNDANVLSLGARFTIGDEAKEAVRIWLETPFSDADRHKRRITKIEELSP